MSKKDVMLAYTPLRQIEICRNEQDCFFGDYPTLRQLNEVFGQRTAAMLMMPHISNLVEFIGGSNPMSGAVQEELAYIIAQEYQYLKVSEIMLFFQTYKRGAYGKQYGDLRTMDILQALHNFVMERRANAKYEYVRQREQAERQEREEAYLRNPANPEDVAKIIDRIKLKKV